jgi:hypothetical protein
MATINVENLSILELNQYLRATKSICNEYEKKIGLNVGSDYREFYGNESSKATNILKTFKEKYTLIINEMMKRIIEVC